MKIDKCKWKYGAKAPVMFMIDDLANKYIYLKEGKNVRGCDWGAKGLEENSFWSILEEEILKKFPYIKVTMFLVVGRREPIINKGHSFYSEAMDEGESFKKFMKNLANKSNVELAYHGYTHGVCSDDIYEFKEEWETFNSVEEAIEAINKGKELFKQLIGKEFKGGKYCGYKYNTFSDESISKTNFSWWCRHWDGNDFFNGIDDLSFELKEFNNVIDIPSTIDGSFYSLRNYKKIFTKKYLKSIYLLIKNRMTLEKQLKYLIENKKVISIQEHTAPYRVDDRIQYPNIISDKENLIYIFKYLSKHDLWYATGSEIAEYYKLYKETKIEIYGDKLIIEYRGYSENKELSIEIENELAEEIILYNENEEILLKCKKKNVFIGEVKVSDSKEYKIKIIIKDEV